MYPRGMQPLVILKDFLCLYGTLGIRNDEMLAVNINSDDNLGLVLTMMKNCWKAML